MRIRSIFLTLAMAVLIAAPTAAFAQRGPGPGHGGAGSGTGDLGRAGGNHGLEFIEHMLPRLAERLELSDEQMNEIRSILDEAQPTIDGFAEQLRAGRDSYREENGDPTIFDEGAFRAHAATQYEIQVNLMVAIEKTKAKVFNELTQEQRDQLEEMRSSLGRKSFRRGGGRHSNR